MICGIGGLLYALAPNLNAVAFNITSEQRVDGQNSVFIEFFLTDGNRMGAFILPGGKSPFPLDATVAGVTKIRWFFPERACDVYELNIDIPGIFGWKDLKISSDSLLFKSSNDLFLVDKIIGWKRGTGVHY
jgi:hypothetical protein